MRKEISRSIRLKIISAKNVIDLINFVLQEFEKNNASHKDFGITFSCEGNQAYSFDSKEVDKCEKVLNSKKIFEIGVHFSDYKSEQRININLAQGDRGWENRYSVNSDKEEWVNDVSIRLEEVFASFRPQIDILKFKGFIYHTFSLLLGWVFFKAIILFFKIITVLGYSFPQAQKTDTANPFIFVIEKLIDQSVIFLWFFKMGIYWLLGTYFMLLLWFKLEGELKEMWPSIEFDFGPDHRKTPQKRRRVIYLFFILIFMPIILNIISTLIFQR